VTSIRQAVGVLGLRTVSTLLIAAHVVDRFAHLADAGFDLRRHWRHSIATGIGAREIAREIGSDADSAFSAGLLHDLGRLALASQMPRAMRDVDALRVARDCENHEAARLCLGIDPMRVGWEVGMRWHLGVEVIAAIQQHHQPPAAAFAGIVDIVRVADNFGHALDLSGDPDERVPALDADAWNRVGPTHGQCLAIFAATEAGIDALCTMLDP